MTTSKVAALVAAVALTLAAGCSSGTGPDGSVAAPPPYAHTGPDAVGVATLDLGSAGPVFGERNATVYYPAAAATVAQYPRFSYSEASTLPAALQGILPAKYDTTTSVDAYVGPPASTHGPYPIVLFSHGYGGERLYYSNLLTGIASWGYVVVSADYLERGLAAQALNVTTTPTAAQDSSVMRSSLTAVESASADPASPLHGVADPKRVAAVGHSAGGGTAFDALDSPAVATAVGWAPVPPSGAPSSKPVMLIGAEGDTVVTPPNVKKSYEEFRGPKALVEISGEGHNTYTDICTGIRSGGGLISYAISAGFVKASLAKLGINGCQASDINPTRFWPIVQYYTVLQLKNQMDGDSSATIPSPVPGQFPGFTITVTQAA
ncbi:MAG TPA: dienelactone hydrolase family protein [Acidimicrobiales bacterium]